MRPSVTTRRVLQAALIALLAAGTLGLTACGGGDREPDLANGKAQFAACGGCHTLADAGTKGDPVTGGPNLDDAFRGVRIEGFKQSSIEGLVKYWVRSPEQKTAPIMPILDISDEDLADLAAYIASVAGTDKESPARPAEPIE